MEIQIQNPDSRRLWPQLERERVNDSMKRRKRKTEILEAARNVLANDGYTNFTMRRIAAEAGMHLKSLQRYFPTKKILLTNVLEYTVRRYYDEQYSRIIDHDHIGDPKGKLLIVVDYLLRDLRNQFTTRFFAELWALATRDDDATAALDEIYALHMATFKKLIAAMNPTLSEITIAHRAAIVAMTLEGLFLVIGHGKPPHAEYAGLEDEVRARILDIVMAA